MTGIWPTIFTMVTVSKKVFECPHCATAITINNLRNRLQRANQYKCETCGRELTDAAREFLDKI